MHKGIIMKFEKCSFINVIFISSLHR